VIDIPVGYGRRLLLSLVPHTGQQDEGWLAAGLKDTQQGPQHDHVREILASRMQSQHRTPETNVDAQVLGNRNTLDNPVGRVFDDQDSDVDTGGEPGVLGAMTISIRRSEKISQ
jgi:hypothetical protein